MSSDAVKEATVLLKFAQKNDKAGKKGDAAKQLQAAKEYVTVQRLFAQALKGPGHEPTLSHRCWHAVPHAHATSCPPLPLTARCADPNLNPSLKKPAKKKHDEVAKRLTALQEKLDPEQAKELRIEQNTYRLIRSSAGLGMTITPQCDIDAVKAGSAAEAEGVPTNYRIKSINGTAVADRNSIIELVQQVEMGKELKFFLERSGGYQHNPVLGADKSAPPLPRRAPPRPRHCVPAALVPLSEA
jgi:hypothetical protein